MRDTAPEPELLDPETEAELPEAELPEADEDLLLDPEAEVDDPAAIPDSGDEAFILPTPLSTRAVAPRDALHLYLREIGRFPLLGPDEEFELSRRVRETGDQDAAFRLVTSHLRLVVKIAMDFQRRWMQNVLDLVQEGNVGLMRAVQKFDPDKGIKFSYYAAFWIKAYILKFIMDNWRLVKIGTTQAQRKLFYNLNKERQRLQAQGFDPNSSTLSRNLGVAESVIVEMDQRLSRQDMSLDAPLGEDGSSSRMDFLPALIPGVEEALAQNEIAGVLREHILTILPSLSDKERDILENRLLSDEETTLREIGEKYGVTRERVRQIEARLLQKLRRHLADKIHDFSEKWIEDHD
jgi:RNA polymerase sigma-32 factor